MKIDYAGRIWDFDLEEMDVAQCEAVEKYIGKGLGEWANQMAAGGVKAVIALWWVMRAQAGENPGPVGEPGDGFRPVRLLAAFHAAGADAAEEEPEEEADPTRTPGSRARGSRRPAGNPATARAAGPGPSPPG